MSFEDFLRKTERDVDAARDRKSAAEQERFATESLGKTECKRVVALLSETLHGKSLLGFPFLALEPRGGNRVLFTIEGLALIFDVALDSVNREAYQFQFGPIPGNEHLGKGVQPPDPEMVRVLIQPDGSWKFAPPLLGTNQASTEEAANLLAQAFALYFVSYKQR